MAEESKVLMTLAIQKLKDRKGRNTVSDRVVRFSSCESGGALGHLAWIFPWSTLLLNSL